MVVRIVSMKSGNDYIEIFPFSHTFFLHMHGLVQSQDGPMLLQEESGKLKEGIMYSGQPAGMARRASSSASRFLRSRRGSGTQ